MNIKLLRRIKKRILDRPRQFQMNCVVSQNLDSQSPFSNEPVSHCGTACCIAGWAYCLRKRTRPEQVRHGVSHSGMLDVAAASLRLSELERHVLFGRHAWPSDFIDYRATPEADAKNAARRIEHFIKYRE